MIRIFNWIKSIFKRKCKHLFGLIDSLSWQGECFYNRVVVFKCEGCGKICYVSRWAFIRGSGALTEMLHQHIEDKDEYYPKWNQKRIEKNVYKFLSQYFTINNGVIYGRL